MRYLTQDLPGIGGALKKRPEDFVVEEAPLYEPCGEGEHVYAQIEKTRLTTFDALRLVAKQLGVRPRDIGYAGMKDAQAVTRQVISVAGVSVAAVAAVEAPGLKVNWVKRHRNKLKLGHLLGNRFSIRVRGVDEPCVEPARAVLETLARRGVPNYFGEQRFGAKGDTHAPGRAMVRGDVEAAVRAFVGGPCANESDALQRARALFDAGKLAEAAAAFPPAFRDERRVIRVLLDRGMDWRAAFNSIPKELKRLFVNAYQSRLFNEIVDARQEQLDELWLGDLAYKHANGACFVVEDLAAEQPRCAAFEISPSGPLYGFKLKVAEGRAGELERALLAREGLELADFKSALGQSARGARRPLRFPIEGADVAFDDGVVLTFFLPKGCYATTVLGEVMKVDG